MKTTVHVLTYADPEDIVRDMKYVEIYESMLTAPRVFASSSDAIAAACVDHEGAFEDVDHVPFRELVWETNDEGETFAGDEITGDWCVQAVEIEINVTDDTLKIGSANVTLVDDGEYCVTDAETGCGLGNIYRATDGWTCWDDASVIHPVFRAAVQELLGWTS